MSVLRHLIRLAAGVVGAVLLSGSSFADIKSFNDAMIARDYKKAAAEAAATWPTLDTSRDDIAIIAREFGFAAYVAGDFVAAKMYGEAAVAGSVTHNETADLRTGSEVLLRVSELRLTPDKAARDRLFAAMQVRVSQPGIDLISYFGADVLTAYDFDRGQWTDAAAGAELGEMLTGKGDDTFAVQKYRFGLFRNVADYMTSRDVKDLEDVTALKARMIKAVNAAATDEAASDLVAFYWQVDAWQGAIASHLISRRKYKWPDEPEGDRLGLKATDRAARLLQLNTEDASCISQVELKRQIEYPSSALYKGIIGTVIMQLDFDENGNSSNPKILAAVPEKIFGETLLKNSKNVRYKPGKKWGPSCSLAKRGRVTTFQFSIQ